jgi:pseudaminic acid synthase
MTFSIANVPIGAGHPCRFVAELSNNHNGSLDRAHRIIDAAKAAGADFAKFQCYTPDELVALRGDGPAPEPWGADGWTMRALYEKAQTPHAWFPELVNHCRDIGLPWFSSVFGAESLALLESLDCPAYKIARLDHQNAALVELVVRNGKPFLISGDNHYDTSTLQALPHEVCLLILRDRLLYCPPGYPQTGFAFRRSVSGTDYDDYGDNGTFGCDRDGGNRNHIGFSFHGSDPRPCVVAATLGAKIIEAHLMLEAEPSELESNVSLTETQFARLVSDVRAVEAMLA